MNKPKPLNEKQVAFLQGLGSEPATLADISKFVGYNLQPGTTNALVKRGLADYGPDRVLVCPCCGRKRTVKTYVATAAGEDMLKELGKDNTLYFNEKVVDEAA